MPSNPGITQGRGPEEALSSGDKEAIMKPALGGEIARIMLHAAEETLVEEEVKAVREAFWEALDLTSLSPRFNDDQEKEQQK